MQHLSFVVRWTDKDGKHHSKQYSDEPAAKKAKAWLVDNGADSIDIAVAVGKKEYRTNGGAIPAGAEPGQEQQTFIK